jgi:FMN phosphatase YigB (HAD superfamily)
VPDAFCYLDGTSMDAPLTSCIEAEARRIQLQKRLSNPLYRSTQLVLNSLRYARKFPRVAAQAASRSFRIASKLTDVPRFSESADIISLDFFDRTVEPPVSVTRRSAAYASLRLSRRGFPISPELFLFVRDETEHRLREQARQSGQDPECKISDLIHETIHSLLGPEAAAEETGNLVDYELEVECDLLRLAPDGEELLEWIRGRGMKAIVVTDTCLERSHIESLLAHLGIARYIASIYVSSEFGLSKYTGRLIRKALECEGAEPHKFVHVGDSYGRDVRGALKAGVTPVFLLDPSRLRRRRQLERTSKRILEGRQPSGSGNTPHGTPLSGEDRELFNIGRDILGPAFCVFLVHVIEEYHRQGVCDVYFLAREGHLLRQIHSVLVEKIRRFRRLPVIRDHYLYVSRLSTSLPSIRAIGKRELGLAVRNHAATLEDYLRTFGLKPAEFVDLLNEFRTDAAVTSKLFADPRFTERLREQSSAARVRLRRYLQDQNFFAGCEAKALVDVGWHGTIQANLTLAFHDDPEFPTLIGHYFGRCYDPGGGDGALPRSKLQPGFFFDEKRPVASEKAIRYCVQIFELAAGAPHGSVVGYEDIGGCVEPVLSASEIDLTREQRLLQAGIMEHAVSFAKVYDMYEPDLRLLRAGAGRKLSAFLARPTLKQVRALKSLEQAPNWGLTKTLPLIATDLSPSSVFLPGRVIQSLRGSFWPEGTLRMSRIPGALSLIALARKAGVIEMLHRRGWRR